MDRQFENKNKHDSESTFPKWTQVFLMLSFHQQMGQPEMLRYAVFTNEDQIPP